MKYAKIALIGVLLFVPSFLFATTQTILTSAATTNCQGETGPNCGLTSDSSCSGSVTYTSSVQPGGTVFFQVNDSITVELGAVQTTCTIGIDGLPIGTITTLVGTGGQQTSGQRTYTASMNPGTYTFSVVHGINKEHRLQNNVQWTAWGTNTSSGSFTVAQPAASITLRAQAR